MIYGVSFARENKWISVLVEILTLFCFDNFFNKSKLRSSCTVLDNTVEYQSRPDTKSHCIALKDSR